jgi:hypothetical protein
MFYLETALSQEYSNISFYIFSILSIPSLHLNVNIIRKIHTLTSILRGSEIYSTLIPNSNRN